MTTLLAALLLAAASIVEGMLIYTAIDNSAQWPARPYNITYSCCHAVQGCLLYTSDAADE